MIVDIIDFTKKQGGVLDMLRQAQHKCSTALSYNSYVCHFCVN